MTIYFDCNATTPVEPRVAKLVSHWFTEEVGNAGSRTHEFGVKAKRAVDNARKQIADVLAAKPDEVIFTSGATEANNLAILGLVTHGKAVGKKHIISTAVEHKAVLEPLEHLEAQGFEITLLKPDNGCVINPDEVKAAIRPDTLLVSVMHVNNETGVHQPLQEICDLLGDEDIYLHTDAAQGFGKIIEDLQNPRIDLISITSHKIYGPIGVGALITRRRKYKRPPLKPLMYGGGQGMGLRPGTLPTPLIVGFGEAASIASKEHRHRKEKTQQIKNDLLECLSPLDFVIHGKPDRIVPHTINLSIQDLDSEAVMLALKDTVAISNGSACTSQNYSPSHVLKKMSLSEKMISGAIRISWSHLNADIDWRAIQSKLQLLTL